MCMSAVTAALMIDMETVLIRWGDTINADLHWFELERVDADDKTTWDSLVE